MMDEIETLTVGVRAEVSGFRRDVAEMRGALEGPLAEGADRATRLIERGLLRAARSGRSGFEDMGRVALTVLADIAAMALRAGVRGALDPRGGPAALPSLPPFSGGAGQGDGLLALGGQLLGGLLGLPGRATGGPVSPGRAYRVGERGPEMFVPTSAGQIAPLSGSPAPRDVRIAIQVNGPPGENGRILARSARQVARAVKAALADD